MERANDGDKRLEDVSRTRNVALGKRGAPDHSLLGVTTVLRAIASPLKVQVQGIAGHALGVKGRQTYDAATSPRRVALLQSPHRKTVNTMLERITVALTLARVPLEEAAQRLAAYRVFLSKPLAMIRAVEKHNNSRSLAFTSARSDLAGVHVIRRIEQGLWRLTEVWEMA